jgi:hypothetical protein
MRMTEPPKKIDLVRGYVAEGNYKKALAIVKTWRRGVAPADMDVMTRAYECMAGNARTYASFGIDTESAIAEGVKILKALYGTKQAI